MPDSPPDSTTSTLSPLAERVRVVLVGPQHPGNIGAAARAMKNMGLADLALVAPRHYRDPAANARAASAVDVLDHARVHAGLQAAVADCTRVVGTTARPRHLSQPLYTPREWVASELARPVAGRIALLFGRERTGLTNAELDLCSALVSIPVNPDYPSLNLAQAVQVLSYELRLAEPPSRAFTVPSDPKHAPVPEAEMGRFYDHLERTLVRIGFLDPDNPRLLMRRLRHLFGRLEPDANEMNILRGILTAAEQSSDNGMRE